ncbi:MAG: L,D-transpeptidase family protein [Chitinispirillales bacterium]|jgi:murein L,D-transpeptidase YafK|nr:L,D-transpeptidase family protein [Chitinispirillales bacterium]
MRFFHSIKRYVAFKLKELEFRYQTWKRAREISRAYDTGRVGKFKLKFTFRPKFPQIRLTKAKKYFHKIAPQASKGAKAFVVVAALFGLGFGLIWAIPHISVAIAANAASGERLAIIDKTYEHYDTSGASSLEAAVLPEGYAEYARGSATGTAQTPSTASARQLADIFRTRMPRGFTEHLVLVDKAAKIMYIYKEGPSGWEILRAYPIATGEVDGPKRVEGDKKTPEGEYFIVGRKHRSELTAIYGPAAFILDYPNPEDRAAGRTGHGIWIHGSDRGDIPPLFTQGCVAVSNPDILDFAGIIRNWAGVPVVIVSGEETPEAHFASVDFERVASRRTETALYHTRRQSEFERIVMNWKRAWESKDIDAYTTFYSTATFVNGRQSWDAYREHKLRTFAAYEVINIGITGFMLTELTSNAATVKFNQTYTTNLNRIENAKRLIFRRVQGEWKIHREIPFPQEELLL